MRNILTIHGVGDQEFGYSRELRRRFTGYGWTEALWSPVLEIPQGELVREMREVGAWYMRSREVEIRFAGDAVAILEPENWENINAVITRAWEDAIEKFGEEPIIVSHSLGTVIADKWAWDSGADIPLLVTMGSPIPMFLAGLDRATPSKWVRSWLNIWSPADLISHPLATLGEAYSDIVKDISLLVGPFYRRFLPSSHISYWGDLCVAEYIKAAIASAVPSESIRALPSQT